jgi:Flp pilus assembly protein TadG
MRRARFLPRAIRRRTGERGSILVETAIVVPLLITILVATFELGMGWRTSVTSSNSARAGARVAAFQGTGYQADYASLIAVASAMQSAQRATITRVIIFKATSGSSTVPAACLALTPSTSTSTPTGLNNATAKCNVYSGSQVTGVSNGTIASTKFGNGANTSGACLSSRLDYYWCPYNRANSQATGLDFVGVYLEVSNKTFSKIFGSSFTIRDTEIMQIEPSATGA